jgi:hypothetical protein
MPDEQDRAESLDDDKGAFPADETPVIDVLDQTADADPGTAEAFIDDDETGNDLVGVEAEPDRGDDPYHTEEPAPEVAAMHLTDDERP